MPITTPIIGNSSVVIGYSTKLSNQTPDGIWSSSDNTIATIDSNGVILGVKSGEVVISYSIDVDSTIFSFSVQPYSITNGFNSQIVLAALRNELTWGSQGDSTSGRHFEDFHALCDEDIVRALVPIKNTDVSVYNSFLTSMTDSVVLEALNSVFNQFQSVDSTKLIFDRCDYRLYLQTVPNSSGFVGITFTIAKGDFSVAFKNLLLFFDKAITFNLYLYNDMLVDEVIKFPVTVLANQQTVIPVDYKMLLTLSYLSSTIKGGRWFLGYYQDDIAAQGASAMFYNIGYSRFNAFSCMAFSAVVQPSPNNPSERNFNRYTIGANSLMYGMNAEVVSYVDPTNNIVQNASLFDNLIGLMMAKKIIELIVFSYRNNKIQVNVMGNDMVEKLYTELNSVESSNPGELNFSNGLRKQISDAKRVVKMGFQTKSKLISGCG